MQHSDLNYDDEISYNVSNSKLEKPCTNETSTFFFYKKFIRKGIYN